MHCQTEHARLVDLQRTNKQLENDASLLRNRLKLLQVEDTRAWKKIAKVQTRFNRLTESQRRAEEQLKTKKSFAERRDTEKRVKQQSLARLKESSNKRKQETKEVLFQTRREAYENAKLHSTMIEGRKKKMLRNQLRQNQEKFEAVRKADKLRLQKLKEIQTRKIEGIKENYVQKIKVEEEKNRNVEQRLLEMELLELEFIRKLQNTQLIQEQVAKNLEDALY